MLHRPLHPTLLERYDEPHLARVRVRVRVRLRLRGGATLRRGPAAWTAARAADAAAEVGCRT